MISLLVSLVVGVVQAQVQCGLEQGILHAPELNRNLQAQILKMVVQGPGYRPAVQELVHAVGYNSRALYFLGEELGGTRRVLTLMAGVQSPHLSLGGVDLTEAKRYSVSGLVSEVGSGVNPTKVMAVGNPVETEISEELFEKLADYGSEHLKVVHLAPGEACNWAALARSGAHPVARPNVFERVVLVEDLEGEAIVDMVSTGCISHVVEDF